MPFLPTNQPTLMPTGIYGYDLEARRQADVAGAQRDAGMRAPVFGAGGIQGGMLGRQVGIEDAFLRAVEEAKRRQIMAEMARQTRESDIANRNRANAEMLGGRAIGNIGSGIVAGIGAAIPLGGAQGQEKPRATAPNATSTLRNTSGGLF